MNWILDDGVYRFGEYEARKVNDVWRLFYRGSFVLSAAEPMTIIRYVRTKNEQAQLQ